MFCSVPLTKGDGLERRAQEVRTSATADCCRSRRFSLKTVVGSFSSGGPFSLQFFKLPSLTSLKTVPLTLGSEPPLGNVAADSRARPRRCLASFWSRPPPLRSFRVCDEERTPPSTHALSVVLGAACTQQNGGQQKANKQCQRRYSGAKGKYA